MNRVVITGMGVISPSGNDIQTFWDNILNARSGISNISKFDTKDFKCKVAGEVKGFDPILYGISKKEVSKMDLFSQYAIAATYMALKDSGIVLKPDYNKNIGTIIGTGIGGMNTIEQQHTGFLDQARVSPYTIPMLMVNAAAGEVSIKFKLNNVSLSTSSACASSASAIIDSFLRIKSGYADVIVSGGTEAVITPFANLGFATMRAINTEYNDSPEKSSMPFNKNRKGFVMSEGAAIMILESLDHATKRGAKIYAEIAGIGESSDSFHICQPDQSGTGAQDAMIAALTHCEIGTSDVQYINAHGTSTHFNDKIEAGAIANIFGEVPLGPYVSSTKGTTGHLLGAAAAIEAIVCALIIKNGVIPPTAHLTKSDVDPECILNHVFKSVKTKVNYAMSNSFGFGGHNTCLVLKKYE